MLPIRYRLTPRSAIADTIRRGRRARSGCVVIHAELPQRGGADTPARAAFAVGRSVGSSVERHRVTRRIRAVMPPILEGLPPGSRIVVRALPDAVHASTDRLARDISGALARVGRAAAATSPAASDCGPSPAVPEAGGTEASGSRAGEPEAGQPGPAEASPTPPRSGLSLVLWWVGAPIRWLALALLYAYRYTISPILPPTCRFHPSCSAYTLQAVQTHGVGKGVLLGVWRLLRCNPWNLGGLDPVPPRGAWRPDIYPDGTPRDPLAVRFTDGKIQPDQAASRPT